MLVKKPFGLRDYILILVLIQDKLICIVIARVPFFKRRILLSMLEQSTLMWSFTLFMIWWKMER